MDSPLAIVGAALGVLALVSLAIFLSLRPRRAGKRPKDSPPWSPDPTLADGHRPPDAGALSSHLLGFARQVLDASGVAVLVADAQGWRVSIVSPGLIASFSKTLPLKEGLLGLAFDGEREIAADPVQPAALGYIPGQSEPLSLALLPMAHRGRVRALLACHRPAGRPFSKEEMALLRRCANLLEGWEHYAAEILKSEASRDREWRLANGLQSILREHDAELIPGITLDALFDVFPAISGFCVIKDPRNQFFCFSTKRFAGEVSFQDIRERTWAHWVIEKSQPIYLEGAASRETAMPILCDGEPFPAGATAYLAPLAFRGEILGVAGLIGKPEDTFSEESRDLAVRFLESASALIRLAAMERHQSRIAIKDGLTGLYNRRFFNDQVEREKARCDRDRVPLSLIMLDIDHFKRVNDTHGHSAGDRALQFASQVMAQSVRRGDHLCRYGGEEFAAILPNCPSAEAREVAERMRGRLESLAKGPTGLPFPMTVSAGIASYPAPFASLDRLIKAADEALYAAKTKGRNRVEVAAR